MKTYPHLLTATIDERMDFLEKLYDRNPDEFKNRLVDLFQGLYWEYAPGELVLISKKGGV